MLTVLPGRPYPLGATFDGAGVNFALFTENATRVELCLFYNGMNTQEHTRITLPEYTDHVWHGYLPDVGPGQLYGYRVYGPHAPEQGHRFNPHKLLLDPYAKAIVRPPIWDDRLLGYSKGNDLILDDRDNASIAPLGVVIDPSFSWGEDRLLQTPWHKTVIYEAHVKSLTALHPDVPPHLRGTYLGVASDPVIQHLKSLGITAIELLPIHQHMDEAFLQEQDKVNYWGYNTLGFFAPDIRYSSRPWGTTAIREFKTMVRKLHAAGIEVILDVVYNHTAEGNHLGPTVSFRGIDNTSYYRLTQQPNKRYYEDFTGCGNTLNMRHPRVLQLIMDSLRYWVDVMHVDGFRFDLASALARELFEVDKLGSFFDIIHQDPILSRVKLIAEPWDLGVGGYQVGNFPILWTEWNGQYRDCVRQFWRGDGGKVSELATRLSGSSDLYQHNGRLPHASINFVTCHDGFTLTDMTRYNQKHNEANGEQNRDGCDHNMSWNCGVEGLTDDPAITALREQQRRNMMATLILSLGAPMINSGDEIGKTQQGNNNAYCQDSELSWLGWDTMNPHDAKFLKFCQRMVALRQAEPVFHRRKFLVGARNTFDERQDILWFNLQGQPMTQADWQRFDNHFLGMLLDGQAISELDAHGQPLSGNTFLLLFHAGNAALSFPLPQYLGGTHWRCLEATTHEEPPVCPLPQGKPGGKVGACDWLMETLYPVSANSVHVFQLVNHAEN